MFVSSYSTYVSTNTSERTARTRSTDTKENTSFSYKRSNDPKPLKQHNFPVDYIAESKTFGNKIELELQKEQLQGSNNEEIKQLKNSMQELNAYSTLQNAKQAYKDNSKIFSLLRIPHATLDQTPTIDKKLPDDLQELQEKSLRQEMLNTYIQNDSYYQITA